MSPFLEEKLEALVNEGVLSPVYWPCTFWKLKNPLMEDAKYKTNPIMEFHPMNSGSLNISKDVMTERTMVVHFKGCGEKKNQFNRIEKGYNEGKCFALLQNGDLAVAPDDTIAEWAGLGADTPVDVYFRLAREMCMRMQHNETLGLGPKKFRHWFNPGYEGGGGAPYSGGAGSKKRSGPSGGDSGKGKGKKKARLASGAGSGGGSASGGVFDFDEESEFSSDD